MTRFLRKGNSVQAAPPYQRVEALVECVGVHDYYRPSNHFNPVVLPDGCVS